MEIIQYEDKYRDDMIFMILQAKDAIGHKPKINEDLLDITGNYIMRGDMFWLAVDEGRVIGSIGYSSLTDSSEAVLHRFYVKADRKHRGIGSAMLDTALKYMEAQGKNAVLAHLGEPREKWFESYSFYKKHGFTEQTPRIFRKELKCRKMTAYFAGGCFWCITPVFRDAPGVLSVTSGYSGGLEKDPTYEAVKKQETMHRETVRVEYDENMISFEKLTEIFLGAVDPFDADGQYIDRGRSYTLAVFYTTELQRMEIEKKIAELKTATGKIPAVSIEPFRCFYKAEEYHQDYDLKNPEEFQRELIQSGRYGESNDT